MSETIFRSCAPILGFLPDFATDFGFLEYMVSDGPPAYQCHVAWTAALRGV